MNTESNETLYNTVRVVGVTGEPLEGAPVRQYRAATMDDAALHAAGAILSASEQAEAVCVRESDVWTFTPHTGAPVSVRVSGALEDAQETGWAYGYDSTPIPEDLSFPTLEETQAGERGFNQGKADRVTDTAHAATLDETRVKLGKEQILRDVHAGHVPVTVSSFAEMHDHTDANMYGIADDDQITMAQDIEEVQCALDAWITSGDMAREAMPTVRDIAEHYCDHSAIGDLASCVQDVMEVIVKSRADLITGAQAAMDAHSTIWEVWAQYA